MIKKLFRRSRRNATHTLARSCSLESLESRRLFSGYSVTRVSLASDGSAPTDASGTSSVSADGNLVVFTSTAALTPGVNETGDDFVYLRNVSANTTTLISKAPDGSQPNAKAAEPEISSNGQFIVYSSPASNLPGAANNNGEPNIFLYNISTDTTTLISQGLAGAPADSSSSTPTISSDGTKIAFLSNADNLVANDTNQASDIFVYNTTTSTMSRVSTDSGNNQVLGASYSPALAAGGGYVAFVSDSANLISNDTNNIADVFLKNLSTGSVQRLSVSTAGLQADGKSGRIAIDSDGQWVAFESSANNLVSGDTYNLNPSANPDLTEIFLRDVADNITTRISVGANNLQANGVSTKPAISANGRFVTYTSAATNLIASDANGKTDIFLYDRTVPTAAPRRISSGPNDTEANDDSDDSSISGDANAEFITFRSNATNLVASDQNGVGDIFLKDRLAVPHATAAGSPDGTNPVDIAPGDITPAGNDGTDFGFGDVANSAGVLRTFTIRNSGSDNLNLSGTPIITITGTNAADFTVITQPSTSGPIAPDGTVTFVIKFLPLTSGGIHTAVIHFSSTDPTTPNYTFTVSGIALDSSNTSRLLITQGATTVPADPTTPFSFGNLPLNSANKTLVFTLTNVSTQNLTLDPVTLDPADGFVITSSLDTLTIAPGASANFTLGMTASITGAASATVHLSNTGADNITSSFTLSGAVTVPSITVLQNTTTLTAGQTIDFGSVVSGSTSVTKTLTIRNDGLAPLIITSITPPSGFSAGAASTTTIQAGQTATFDLTLSSATAAGAKSGQLTISTNDPVAPIYVLTLTGSVTVPSISLTLNGSSLTTGTTLNFPAGVLNQSGPTKTITITNSGAAPLNIGAPTVSPATSGGTVYFSTDKTTTFTIAAGQSSTILISELTATFGALTGNTLSFTTNDTNNPTYTLPLTGSNISQPLTILVDGVASSSQSIPLGKVPQSPSRITRTITLRNDGTKTINLTGSISLTPGFTLSSNPSTTSLASGASTTFSISFVPLAAGTQSGILSVSTDDSSHPTFTAGISATVTPVAKTTVAIDSVTVSKLPSVITGGIPASANIATAKVTLHNYSAATVTGSYKITLYATQSAVPTPGVDKVLGTLTVSLKLAPKSQAAYSVKLSFPAPPVDGAYTIAALLTGAKADPVFHVASAPIPYRIERAAAKLGKGSLASPAVTVARGKKATQIFSLANSGNTAITGSLSADLYLSTDATLSHATKIGTITGLKINVKAKASQKLTISFTPLKSIAAGSYTLLLVMKKVTSPTASSFLNSGLLSAGKITVTTK
jgi:hypothetical protein